MIGAYCNMSVPPKTKMEKVVRPVGDYVSFGLHLIGYPPGDFAEIPKLLDTLDVAMAPRPHGYTIVVEVPEASAHANGAIVCRNKTLTLAVVSRIVGGLYIPRHLPRIGKENASAVFQLPVSAFPPEAYGLLNKK
ncbi:MAG: hypothetical protein IKO40_07755 [Kiritimatiellae bacterium]|nr:hypothetical protein [Kiritimatiellia bacterium]